MGSQVIFTTGKLGDNFDTRVPELASYLNGMVHVYGFQLIEY